ncbi:MAG: hypothetical protein HYX57_07325 [Chloroflexi bacterium]|nr:hypothetical protein [Chloroflexota bacterium]
MRKLRAFTSHTALAFAEAGLIALLIVGLVAGTALAAKGGGGGGKGGGGGSLALVMVADANGNGAPNWRDTITFNVSTTATASPFVSVNCYQGSTWVLTASAGFFASYPWTKNTTLSSSAWTGGSASCTARLYSTKDGTRTTTLATLNFSVGS